MALPSSGSISLNQVNVELGNSGSASINMNSSAIRGLFGVSSGAISMSNGHGKSASSPTQFALTVVNEVGGTVIPWDSGGQWLQMWWNDLYGTEFPDINWASSTQKANNSTIEILMANSLAGNSDSIVMYNQGPFTISELFFDAYDDYAYPWDDDLATTAGGIEDLEITFHGTVDTNMSVDWDDTTSSSYSNLSGGKLTKSYPTGGVTFDVEVTCTTPFSVNGSPVLSEYGDVTFTAAYPLSNWNNFTGTPSDTPNLGSGKSIGELTSATEASSFKMFANMNSWDTSSVTDMSRLLYQSYWLSTSETPNMASWDTSNVTDMSYMFSASNNINPNVTNWDVGSVTTFRNMLPGGGASPFNRNISGWDTSSAVDMRKMLAHCYNFNYDISSWDVSGVTTAANAYGFRWKSSSGPTYLDLLTCAKSPTFNTPSWIGC
jgi:hypothetical protein